MAHEGLACRLDAILLKEIPVAHEGLACHLDAILLCIMHAQEVWIQSARAPGLSGSPSVSSFSSGECGNAILWYCYGCNRLF